MKNIGIILLALATIIILAIGFTSGATTTLNLFAMQAAVPAGAVLIAGYIIGVGCTFALLASRYSAKAASSQQIEQWQAQDQKLLQQVQTDKEKQLEAKIATLEAALQRALKR